MTLAWDSSSNNNDKKCKTHDCEYKECIVWGMAVWLFSRYQRLEGVCYQDFYPEEGGRKFNRNHGINITEMHGVASADNIVHAALCSKVLRRDVDDLAFSTNKKGGDTFFVACQTCADIWWNKLQACTTGVPVFTQLMAVYLFAL